MLRVVSFVSVVFKKMSTLHLVSFVKPLVSFAVKPIYKGTVRVRDEALDARSTPTNNLQNIKPFFIPIL